MNQTDKDLLLKLTEIEILQHRVSVLSSIATDKFIKEAEKSLIPNLEKVAKHIQAILESVKKSYSDIEENLRNNLPILDIQVEIVPLMERIVNAVNTLEDNIQSQSPTVDKSSLGLLKTRLEAIQGDEQEVGLVNPIK